LKLLERLERGREPLVVSRLVAADFAECIATRRVGDVRPTEQETNIMFGAVRRRCSLPPVINDACLNRNGATAPPDSLGDRLNELVFRRSNRTQFVAERAEEFLKSQSRSRRREHPSNVGEFTSTRPLGRIADA
jgi:hypothetical protein